jgi:hypothetical protein
METPETENRQLALSPLLRTWNFTSSAESFAAALFDFRISLSRSPARPHRP